MSTSPESDLDLNQLFLPAWAQQPANKNLYEHHTGEDRHDRRGRGDRPRGPGGPRGERPGGQRPGGFGGPRPHGAGGERRGGDDRRGGPRGSRREGQRGGPRGERREAPEPQPLPEVDVLFRPEENGVESLARQIKMTGRAYPLFDIAQLFLQKPERHSVIFTAKKKPDGTVAQQLFACALDDTLWLSEDEAVAYILEKHFATFYQAERTQTDPPKGTYTFVAQCGMSGVILGPPNYHDYQNQLRKLHAERFARMPFDMFKSRVRIVKDEEVVKKWIEEQSWKTEYNALNVPEPVKFQTRDEVERHFRATHLANIVRQVDTHTVSGPASRNLPCRALLRLVRVKWEEQRRFPLQLATTLSQQFASRALQFFKVNKTVTHVAVARPTFLDIETNPVSENVKRIMEFVNAHPKCTRRDLFNALAPSAVSTTQAPAEGSAPVELTPEASAIITELHWLVHQGHVIEFANGTLETAKKPIPKPPKAPKPEPKTDEASASDAALTETAAASAEPTIATEHPGSPTLAEQPVATSAESLAQAAPESSPETAPSGDATGVAPSPS